MLRISFTILFIFYFLEPDMIIFAQDSSAKKHSDKNPQTSVLRPTGQALCTITTVAIILVR